jgi:hypothetical protein
MTDFLIKRLPYDLSSHAGLAFIGKYLKRININGLIDPAFPVRSGIANSDILKSYLGLLCLGKNDFDASENFRGNAFSCARWGCGRCCRVRRCVALTMHCATAAVSPAFTVYRLGPLRPSLSVNCHFLSLSSKLM